MANIKELIEQRNSKIEQIRSMVSTAKEETRGFNDDETADVKKLEDEIKQINVQIVEERSKTFSNENEVIEENRSEGDNKMDRKEEVRALEDVIRGKVTEETRALNTTSEGAPVIPEIISGEILKKVEESSPVFAQARKFASVSGSLSIAREDDSIETGFVGEGQNLSEVTLKLKDVKLTQKRAGAALVLTKQLIHDAAVDIVSYSADLLARRLAKGLEKSIFNGTGGEQFNGLDNDREIKKIEIEAQGAVTTDILLDAYNSINPIYLNDCAYYMSREFYNEVSKLKDGDGHYFMQRGIVNGVLQNTFFGRPIYITDAIDKTANGTQCFFGSVNRAYGMMIKEGISLQRVNADTTQALRGSELLVIDTYMDGNVINPEAIVKIVKKSE